MLNFCLGMHFRTRFQAYDVVYACHLMFGEIYTIGTTAASVHLNGEKAMWKLSFIRSSPTRTLSLKFVHICG